MNFLKKLNIKYDDDLENLNEFIDIFYPEEWNYTKIIKNIFNDKKQILKYFYFIQSKKSNMIIEKSILNNSFFFNCEKINVILIEFEKCYFFDYIVLKLIERIKDFDWFFTIICIDDNFDFISKKIKMFCEINEINQNKFFFNRINKNEKDKIFTSVEFWNNINCENILITDSSNILTDKIDKNIFNETYLFGNFKFSLRKKSILIKILQKYDYKEYLSNKNQILISLMNKTHGIHNLIKKRKLEKMIEFETLKLNEFFFFIEKSEFFISKIEKNEEINKIKNKFDNMFFIFNEPLFDLFYDKFFGISSDVKYIKNSSQHTYYLNLNNNQKNKIQIQTNDLNDLMPFLNSYDFCFIILRHMNSYITSNYWKKSYESIRKYHTELVIIIDDGSNPTYNNHEDIHNLENVFLINSEFGLGHGEILPYYYLQKLKIFKKAFVLHDSMFINKKMDIENMVELFFWSFDVDKMGYESYEYEIFLLNKLNYSKELINLHNQPTKFKGIFGCCGLILYETIKIFNDKYNIFNLMNHVYLRTHRSCLERIIGVLYFNEKRFNGSLCGNIAEYYKSFNFTYDDYIKINENEKIKNIFSNYNIIKIWSGR